MTNRPKLLLVLIILASGGLYLIGNGSVALWDRDEPRYAQTSRQMLQSGDWVVPHYLNLVRTAKPALIYWCQASAMEIFGDNAFAARFPSAVATTLLLVLLSLVLWRAIGPERTVWTVFIFATSGLVIAAAKMCLTDAVLTLWITIAQLCLYFIWRGRATWGVISTMAVAIGLAGLTKGPIVLGFLAVTLLALAVLRLVDRRFPPLPAGEETINHRGRIRVSVTKAFVGVVIVAAIIAPWIGAIEKKDPSFLRTSFFHEVLGRMVTPQEQHSGPPGYYLLTIWATFFPWSVLLPLAIGLAIRYRRNPQTRFALAAVVGPWIMLECIRTKLPHYFLPAFPPLAFLTADALVRCLHGQHQDLKSKSFIRGIAIWAVLVTLLCSTPWLALLVYKPQPIPALIILTLFGIIYSISIFSFFKAHRVAVGALAMGIGMMFFVTLLYTCYLPRAEFLRLSPRVADILIAHGVTHPNQVIMLDYMEPSLAFAQGGTIREAGDVGLNTQWIPHFTPWMVITREIWKTAPENVRDLFDIVAEERGLDYADKRHLIDVMIIRKKDNAVTADH